MNSELAQKYQEVSTPSTLFDNEQFVIKLAENEEEIKKALRLRYEVFNLEQGKGLASANQTGMDRDEFDDYCYHLLVIDKSSEKPVGTYRLHLGMVANSAKGFYSAREYDISGLDSISHETMEVGRSCVAPEFRKGSAVALLWAGIGELMKRAKHRYLLGCVSLETVEPIVGWGLYEHFKRTGKISDLIQAVPKNGFQLEKPSDEQIDQFLAKQTPKIPPLFKGYLRLGAAICGEPVLDAEFGTIDYMIVVDTSQIPERYSRHFNYEINN